MHILVTIIFPIVGGLLGLALSVYPMLAMPTIERTRSLGGFNPRPSCVFLCTSMLWCMYGVVMGNAFVFCAVRTVLLWSDGGFLSFACRPVVDARKGVGKSRPMRARAPCSVCSIFCSLFLMSPVA
jgi:hypothetical protein